MSCTVIAVPYALLWVVSTFAGVAAGAVSASNQENEPENVIDVYNNDMSDCSEDVVITEKHFIEKIFQTPFMDREILMKTLNEEGVVNISEWENGLACEVDNYKLLFEQQDKNKPYTLKISCLENQNAEEKAADLNNEYAMNVQEDAYLHILDKLKENNMQIENEEVMDDNTIVLTVNIE